MISLIARVFLSFSLVAGAAAVSIAQEEAEKAGTAQQEGGQPQAEQPGPPQKEPETAEVKTETSEDVKAKEGTGEEKKAEQQADEVAAEKVESKSEKPQPEETAEKAVPAEEAGAKEAGAKEAGAKEAAEAKSPATETPTEESAGRETGEEESPTKEAPAEESAAKQPAAARREDEKTALPRAWVDKLQWAVDRSGEHERTDHGAGGVRGRPVDLLVGRHRRRRVCSRRSITASRFEHQFDKEATVAIGDVPVAPTDKNIVWVGTGEANPRNSVSYGDGVYKSTDGGKTWTNMGLKGTFQIGTIAIHPKDPNIVYVARWVGCTAPARSAVCSRRPTAARPGTRSCYVDDKTGVIDVQDAPDASPTRCSWRPTNGSATLRRGDPVEEDRTRHRRLQDRPTAARPSRRSPRASPPCKLGRIGISIYRRDPKQVYLVVESEKIAQWPDKAPLIGLQGEDADVARGSRRWRQRERRKRAGSSRATSSLP